MSQSVAASEMLSNYSEENATEIWRHFFGNILETAGFLISLSNGETWKSLWQPMR